MYIYIYIYIHVYIYIYIYNDIVPVSTYDFLSHQNGQTNHFATKSSNGRPPWISIGISISISICICINHFATNGLIVQAAVTARSRGRREKENRMKET